MSPQGFRKPVGVVVVIAASAALIVAPATAASGSPGGKDRLDRCSAAPRQIVVREVHAVALPVRAAQLRAELAERIELLRPEQVIGAFNLGDCDADRAMRGERRPRFVHESESRITHPVAVAIDALVGLARIPGKGALVAEHLFTSVAKAAPRLLRALL